MPRPRNVSKLQKPPRIRGLNPMGFYAKDAAPITLFMEEYESIRLLDYEGLSQVEAARIMEVSRPTLTRIYERARKKMATVITEGHQLIIDGGKATFAGRWFECNDCLSQFTVPTIPKVINCPLCNSINLTKIESQS